MNDLPRLKLASSQPACRLLLESALEDHSAPGAAERALYALNLGVGAAAGAAAVHAGTSASAGGHFAGGLVLKWLVLGLLAGGVTLVSVEQVVRVVSESQAPKTALSERTQKAITPQTQLEGIPAAAPGLSEIAPQPASAPAERQVEAPDRRVPDPAPAAAQASESATDPLQELRVIRRALAEHAPLRALTLLEAFVARYPSSSLLEEASVLRFDALVALGRSQARREGEAFLQRYPRSAYAERVRGELSRLP